MGPNVCTVLNPTCSINCYFTTWTRSLRQRSGPTFISIYQVQNPQLATSQNYQIGLCLILISLHNFHKLPFVYLPDKKKPKVFRVSAAFTVSQRDTNGSIWNLIVGQNLHDRSSYKNITLVATIFMKPTVLPADVFLSYVIHKCNFLTQNKHAYRDGTVCSETSAYKFQTPGNYPEESKQHSKHGGSLKSRNISSPHLTHDLGVGGQTVSS